MNFKEAERYALLHANMDRMGISDEHKHQLLRIEKTLSKWSEHECNGVIQRDEKTDKPYWYSDVTGKRLAPVADREKGALKRLATIMANYPNLIAYHQGDPRGCSLYLCDRATTPQPIDSYYSRGLALCY
jgi:hypothetical protein